MTKKQQDVVKVARSAAPSTFAGAGLGAVVGFFLGGPLIAAIGGAIGGYIGGNIDEAEGYPHPPASPPEDDVVDAPSLPVGTTEDVAHRRANARS